MANAIWVERCLWTGKEEESERMKREDQVLEVFFLFMYLCTYLFWMFVLNVFFFWICALLSSSLSVLAVIWGSSATVWFWCIASFLFCNWIEFHSMVPSFLSPNFCSLNPLLLWKTDAIDIYFSLLFYSFNTISNSSFVLYKPSSKLVEC